MTHILNSSHHTHINLGVIRVASRATAPAKRFSTMVVQSLASLPPAISKAFAMAYADPFQPPGRGKDHADPQNF